MSGRLQAVATVLSWKEPQYCLNRKQAGSNSKSGCLEEERPFCCCCWELNCSSLVASPSLVIVTIALCRHLINSKLKLNSFFVIVYLFNFSLEQNSGGTKVAV